MNTKEVAKKAVEVKKETTNVSITAISLDSLNLDNLIKKSEKRKSLYKYSAELLADDNYKDLQKKKRKEIRNGTKKIALAVAIAYKEKNEESKKKAINEFNSFYKKNFQTNDFSFESFSQVSIKEDKDTHNLYTIVLQIVSEFNKENNISL